MGTAIPRSTYIYHYTNTDIMNKLTNELRVCCAAFRESGGYSSHKDDPDVVFRLAENTLYRVHADAPICTVTDQDITLADEMIDFIRKYRNLESLEFNKDELSYSQSYLLSIFRLLDTERVSLTNLRKLAKLPDFYVKYKSSKIIKRKAKFVEDSILGNPGEMISNVLCEIIHTIKTKHYNGYNVTGIIDYKLVSWYSPYELSLGMYSITTAIIKNTDYCYYADKNATRLTAIKGYKINDESN